MSSKRRNVEVMDAESDSSSSESEEDPELQKYVDQCVMVDFEGRCPTHSDYHGIRQLLLPLLPRAHVNWGQLADIIIAQNQVGSVLKQCDPEGPDADDDDDDAMDADSDKEVYGVTTVINLTERRETDAVKELKQTLLSRCKSAGAARDVQLKLEAALSSTTEHTALLLNERFVNIPLQICVPLLTSLRDEIEEAAKKSMPFKFSHFVLISKLHRPKGKGKKKDRTQAEPVWVNGEDEIFDKAAEASFEFSVAEETDTAVDGRWTDRDTLMTPYRRVLLLPAAALPPAIDEITRAVQKLPQLG
ncbi:protein BCCIP homolog isoform X1 [Amphibalanus amphitrite]|uniref:protein BCCIP homolog isoform X1 n=2 Tax=Amphibalanus amphitrite TaxID=1232801 RepID=UPI001C9180F2|nr:protein BCCIP homolog isoform X1 [Amphibalanus amphitrite]